MKQQVEKFHITDDNKAIQWLYNGEKITLEFNDAWVQGGIDAERHFYLASDPTEANRKSKDPKYPRTIFDRELKMLEKNGYTQDGNYMKPKNGCK